MKQLPEKYYLTHFNEFLTFIGQTSSHLLGEQEVVFIEAFQSLSHDAQCLLVRMINRKSAFIKKETLNYQEINDIGTATAELRKAKMIARISKHSYYDLIGVLNKQELITLATPLNLDKPVISAKKNKWQNFVQSHLTQHLDYNSQKKSSTVLSYIHFIKQPVFNFLLFIYFGHLNGKLNQFSLRDLGVMNTRSVSNQQANFISRDEAVSAFAFSQLFVEIKACDPSDIHTLQDLLSRSTQQSPAIGALAQRKYHHGLYHLGLKLLDVDFDTALTTLERSHHPAAQERVIRLLFKQGEHLRCKEKLNNIINDPSDEALLIFAEDFYAQKFEKKRTSVLTDILRKSTQPYFIDEAYLGNVEAGVKALYAQQGITSYFTENKLWRALFGLTFWQELYDGPLSEHANEFSVYPKVLKENRFYASAEDAIEQKLVTLKDSKDLITHLRQTITLYQGTVNGLFFWHDSLLEVLEQFVIYANFSAIIAHLRSMTQRFNDLCDGYPDLMVVEGNQIRFEEIKAPGDSLRRNQLVSIKHLNAVGFDVCVKRVQWQFNAQQRYVVVDIETTGGKKDYHRITEVGMVLIENGQIRNTWQSLINPERSIPKMITTLTGIDNEMVKDAPTFSHVADEIERFTQNAIFVAHNVNFDYGFIKQEFAKLNKPFIRAKLCTVQQARKYLPGYQSYSLGKLSDALNIKLTNHHRALDDATAAAEILLKINQERAKQAS